MNYFSKIKPVLNKLSELNVYDSLEVVRAYIQASADGKDMKLEFEDAYCYAIEEEYRIDAMMRRTVKLSIVANEVTFEGATFKNPYINEK